MVRNIFLRAQCISSQPFWPMQTFFERDTFFASLLSWTTRCHGPQLRSTLSLRAAAFGHAISDSSGCKVASTVTVWSGSIRMCSCAFDSESWDCCCCFPVRLVEATVQEALNNTLKRYPKSHLSFHDLTSYRGNEILLCGTKCYVLYRELLYFHAS